MGGVKEALGGAEGAGKDLEGAGGGLMMAMEDLRRGGARRGWEEINPHMYYNE